MASGDTLIVAKAMQGMPPATLSAGLSTLTGGATPSEQIPRWAFDDSTVEYMDFVLRMPRNYGGGGVTISFLTGGAATSNAYVIGAAFRRVQDDAEDLDSTAHSYDFNDSSGITTPSAVGEVGYDDVAFTNGADMDSVAAGELFILRVRRNTGSGSDTMTGDMYLYGFEIRET